MDNDTIPRNVAKWLLASVIDIKTTQFAADTADNYTRFEKDDLIVKLGAGAIGMVVAANLKPYTDKIIDTGADFIVVKRVEFRAKKDAKKKDKE